MVLIASVFFFRLVLVVDFPRICAAPLRKRLIRKEIQFIIPLLRHFTI